MKASHVKRVKYGCYMANIGLGMIVNLSPLLFLTFHGMYGISYSLLGSLVLINFLVQLSIDLIFSFFSHKFNIPGVVKTIPLITMAGIAVYALWPLFMPETAYIGLSIGTVIFSASGGLVEVLVSPVVAALPYENSDREVSGLHSAYAWGVAAMIVFSTVFLKVFGSQNWHLLTLALCAIPLSAVCLFFGCEFPRVKTPEKVSGAVRMLKNKTLLLCVFAILLGAASELSMAQWSSGYIEQALGIPKIWGDMFGAALFSVMMGVGRSFYTKYGKNVEKFMFFGVAGATLCYLVAVFSNIGVIGLIACAMTGFCTSMLWPGMLIVAADRVPQGGVFVYALMASGGDFGASLAPQLVGVVTDLTASSPVLCEFAHTMALTPEQLGMKLGMLTGMLFPLVGIAVYLKIWRDKNKNAR